MKFILACILSATLFIIVLSQAAPAQNIAGADPSTHISGLVLAQDTYLSMSQIKPTMFGALMNGVSLVQFGSNAYDAYIGGTREQYYALMTDAANRGLHFVLVPIAGAVGVSTGVITLGGGAYIGAGMSYFTYMGGSLLINQVFPAYSDSRQLFTETTHKKPDSNSYFNWIKQENVMNAIDWNFQPKEPSPSGVIDDGRYSLDDVEDMLEEDSLHEVINAHFWLSVNDIFKMQPDNKSSEKWKESAAKLELSAEARDIIKKGATDFAMCYNKLTSNKKSSLKEIEEFVIESEKISKSTIESALQTYK